MQQTMAYSHAALRSPDAATDFADALLWEALCRGAQQGDLIKLYKAYESQSKDLTSPMAVLGIDVRAPMGRDLIDFRRDGAITKAVNAYEAFVSAEYDGGKLDHVAKESFWYDDKSKRKDAYYPKHYYSEMRVVYYNSGYTRPVETIFSKIKSYNFLGRKIPLHELAGERLKGVERTLDKLDPSLVARFSQKVRTIGGFVPRFIAPRQGSKGKRTLSNHAFGLAIDMQWESNPHIKDVDVIRVVREITGFDFGKLLVPEEAHISDQQRLEQTFTLARTASERLQIWLRQYLPMFERSFPDGNTANLRFALTDEKPLMQSQVPRDRPFLDALLRSGVSTDPAACPSIDERTGAQFARLAVLLKFHKMHELYNWAFDGIQTLPLWLISAMAINGFQWGAMYKTTKDFMHFELDPNPQNVLRPDSGHRSLAELFDDPRSWALRSLALGKKARHTKHAGKHR